MKECNSKYFSSKLLLK